MTLATLVPIPPADLARVEQLAGLTIRDAAHERDAVDGLAFVQGVARALDAARKERVGPLNAQVDAINAEFRPYLDSAKQAEGKVKAALLDWRQRERLRIEAEQRRVREENERRERAAREEQLRLEADARATEQAERARVAAETEAAAKAAGFTASDAAELAALESADVAPVPPPVVEAPVRLVAPSAPLSTVRASAGAATVRRVVDRAAIQDAVNGGLRELAGCRIYPVWQFEVVTAAEVPDTFKRDEIAGRRA